VEEFFEPENPSNVLLVFADMTNDSKNRINMCRCIVTNLRLKRTINKQNADQLLIKHVCFIIRIDTTKEDQSISFGREWRQYTIDLLNGKGNSNITMLDLTTKSI